jgi:uncharacterized protein YgiM (DUF1202 family)
MRTSGKIFPALLVLFMLASAVAAQNDCSAMVEAALAATDAACSTVGRNQACYGSAPLEAESTENTAEFTFAAAGDLVDLNQLAVLRSAALDADSGAWGIALLRVQANLPEMTPEQNMTMVVFGDVEVTNAGTDAQVLTAVANTGANVRQLPRENGELMGSLTSGASVNVVGRLSDGSWLQIEFPADSGQSGWVLASLLTVAGDVDSLNVVDPNVPQYRPMQAFYFRSGIGDAACAEAPQSGILIQTPEAAGRVLLSINDVNIRIGSTAFLQAVPGGALYINLLEGTALVEAGESIVFVPEGTRARVRLNNEGRATGTPIGPDPYDDHAMAVLPISL